MCGGQLRIMPHLPVNWEQAKFRLWWRESQLQLTITRTDVTVEVLDGPRQLQILTEWGVLTGENKLHWIIAGK